MRPVSDEHHECRDDGFGLPGGMKAMPAWTQFGTAVLGGAVGAVLTQAATFLRDRLNKHEEGTFLSLIHI